MVEPSRAGHPSPSSDHSKSHPANGSPLDSPATLEILSLLRSMHAIMQSREEREALLSRPSMNSVPATITPQLPHTNQWRSPHVTSQSVSTIEFAVASDENLHHHRPSSPLVEANSRATEPVSAPRPHSAFPAQARESSSAINIVPILEAIRSAVSNLHEAVIGSEEETNRAEPGRSTDKHFKSTRFGLKKERLHRAVHSTTGGIVIAVRSENLC